MTAKFIPTRSGDGTFVLESCRFQYTLFASFFRTIFTVFFDARLIPWDLAGLLRKLFESRDEWPGRKKSTAC
jgi:hypothetical protein